MFNYYRTKPIANKDGLVEIHSLSSVVRTANKT